MKNIGRINTLLLFLILFCCRGMAANYLCFTAEMEGSSVWYVNGADNEPNVQYSLNGVNWSDWTADTPVTLANIGDKVYVRGDNPDGFSHDNSSNDANGPGTTNSRFKMSGRIAASGSVMSLIDGVGISTQIPCAYCFSDLFRDCVSLTKAPELPATELAPNCYALMFQKCTNLTNAPELPATELAARCYISMFLNCSSLTDVPASLPATKMEIGSYWGMFAYCSKLIKSPELSATELAPRCYNSMFIGCESLAEAPKLVATELADSCYFKMFSGCTSLVKAPELPADSWKKGCYSEMFSGCTSLNYIKVDVLTLDNDLDATKKWVDGIDGEGVFIFLCGSKYDKHGASEVPTNFTIISSPIVVFQNPDSTEIYRDTIGCDVMPVYRGIEPPYWRDDYEFVDWDKEVTRHSVPGVYYYTGIFKEIEKKTPSLDKVLCFTAVKDGSSVLYNNFGNNYPDVEYTLDSGITWHYLRRGEAVVLKNKGDKMYLRGDNPDGFSFSESQYSVFNLGWIAASGSVMSLIDQKGEATEIPNDYCFYRLFSLQDGIVQAPELTATKLKKHCYASMFYGCSNLQKGPEIIPATTLAESCCADMFCMCENLQEVPQLPATTLAESCYAGMFYMCDKLENAPELPAVVMEKSCYNRMFGACENLLQAPKLPATILAESCYQGMFYSCYKLEKAPELPATELAPSCYKDMFVMCSSLENIPELPAIELAPSCYESMFYGCGSIEQTPTLPATTLASRCYAYMFFRTLLNGIPTLPATELSEYCYAGMFKEGGSIKHGNVELPATVLVEGCYEEMFTKVFVLDSIKVGVMTLDNQFNATTNWVDGIDYEGVFVFPCGSKYDKHGVSEVPENFTIISSPIVVFQNPDGEELYRDTIGCDVLPEYKGETPTYGEGLVFKDWDPALTIHDTPGTYYYTAVYEEKPVAKNNWLCFTAEEAGSTVGLYNVNNEPDIHYSLDSGQTWVPWAETDVVTLKNVGDKVYVKGVNPDGFSHTIGLVALLQSNPSSVHNTSFRLTGRIAASGSLMSLIDGVGEAKEIPCEHCFSYLFSNQTALVSAPELTATTMKRYCYLSMFRSCSNLIETPELPATQLALGCYSGMFIFCDGLTKASALPATQLTSLCYNCMFYGCSSLTEVPDLPATTLRDSCYRQMFGECTSLTKAPELLATTWAKDCYLEMFKGCTSLNYIKVNVLTLDNNFNATKNWVDGIDGDGVFVFPCGSKYDKHGVSEVPENFTIIGSPIVVFQNPDGEELYRDTIGCDVLPVYRGETPTYGEGLVFKGWDKELTIHEKPDTYYYTALYEEYQPILGNWLCFTAEEDNSVVSYISVGNNQPDVMYSVDEGKTWKPLQEDEDVKLEKQGDKVYLKGDNPTGFSKDENNYTHIWTRGKVSASGSVMSLIDEEGVSLEIPTDYCFYHLFANSPALVTAPELPATELKKSCYEGMFENCAVLEKVPALPATTLADRCYKNMFGQCYKIKETPMLPATTLAKECYYTMFSSCMEVTEAPLLPATVMADSCYYGMFSGCYGLTEAPALPATHLAKSCYSNMFWDCWNLEVAPALPATELEESCYEGMFTECGNLTKAPALPATVMKDFCYSSMFSGCEKLLEAPELPATKLAMYCYNSMFLGCENLTEAPELPAQELAPACYMYMFEGCSNLIYIKVGVLSLDNSFDATTNWVAGIDGFGVFVFPCGSKYDKHGRSEVPDNFTIISSPVVVFQNPDGEELYRDTIGCDVLPVYRGETPTYKEGLVFKGWDPELTIHPEPDTFYYTAVYEKELTPIRDVSRCLCFTIEEAGSWIWYESPDDHIPNIEYSIDSGVTWQPFVRSETWGENKLVFDNVGDKIYVRGVNPDGFSFSREHPTQFHISGKVAASGSVMSLIDGEGYYNVIPSEYCFSSLFESCSLTQAPELTATTLTRGCYDAMFNECTNLTQSPTLPATTLAESCYHMMFAGCQMLQTAPELLSTTLADSCYSGMFYICENLETAPVLPATTLAAYCYSHMFVGCHRLTEAPELPATELKTGCYEAMFLDCSRLNYIKVGVMTLDNDFDATLNWVQEIDGEGTFIFPCGSKYDKHGISEVPDHFKIISSPVVIFQNPDGEELYRDTIGCDVLPEYRGETPTYGDGMVFKGWDKELTIHPEPDTFYYTAVYEEGQTSITDVSKCLCFTAEKANSYVYYQNHGGNSPDVQYSIDEGRTWQSWGENEVLILKNVGEKIYVRGTNPDGFSHMANLQKSDGEEVGQFTNFKMSGEIAASGSVMSLIDGKGESLVIPCDYCFAHLFNSTRNPQQHEDVMTTALTKAPELPATTLTMGCYLDMFGTCSLLKEAPVLPATELASSCYVSMFNNCRSLEIAPALPATKLSKYCYEGMFSNSGIVVAPELPATDLMDSCYWGMFRLCKNMESAPELLATELKPGCYEGMFAGCSNLNYIKVGVMTLDNDFAATNEWVTGVNGPGTFIFPCGSKYDKHGISEVPDNFKIISSPVVIFQNPDGEELYRDTIGCDVLPEYRGETPTYGEGLVFKGWDPELTIHPEPDTFYYTAVYEERQASITDVSKCLCFTAEEAGSEVWYVNEMNNAPDVQYSVDGGRTWNVLAPEEHVVLTSVGDKVYLRGNNPSGFSHERDRSALDLIMPGIYTHFGMTGSIAASGSVMSLIDEVGETTEIPNENCFYKLFEECSSLIQAPELSATTLKESCYESMFYQCTSLTQAPVLPATKMADRCYLSMFASCSNLTETPQLSATELAPSCYSSMFYSCESLVAAPELPATQLANACYASMFSECTSLTETPKLIATTLSDECYRWMFRGCTSLTKAPELPATTLAHSCYAGMFSKCSSLTDAPELPATTLAEYCYGNMFNGCSNLTTAPELPAAELVNECYNGMFGECHSLNYIKVGVMSLDNNFEYGATRDWVSGVDGPGVFIFPCGSTYDKHGVSEVPDDFEIMRGAVIVIFQNPDSTVLWKDTINCNEVPEYKGETPTMGEDYFFIGWDKELTAVGDESVYYITAVYEDLNKYKSLHLTVDDTLYLVLPGGSETIGYELLEGGGSRYEIWYDGVMITEGTVTNDSTVQLICPEDFTPGAYAATLVMYDGRNGRASSDFEFNVMLPDNKENSYYVKVWNDVVICRNGDGIFQSYLWYKDRRKQEKESHQYYNDITLLNGEYMVYVCDVYGKCYFIEPTSFQIEEAGYSVSAHPNVVDRGTDFTISVSGVDDSHLKDARIVIYRSDGVVARIIDDVEVENEMRLGLGEYVIVLTVSDGKNANCKVLIK